MTTTPQPSGECRPPDGAKDRSLHWVKSETYGFQAWLWIGSDHGSEWRFGLSGTSPGTAYRAKWRYIGPASPTDASDLAAALARVKRLETALREVETADPLLNSGHDYSRGWNAAKHRIREIARAALAKETTP